MSYVIEEGIPLPTSRKGGYRHSGPRSPWTKAVDKLEPGQSVLTTEYSEFKAAEQLTQRNKPRKYAIRKVPGMGWRVWRLE